MYKISVYEHGQLMGYIHRVFYEKQKVSFTRNISCAKNFETDFEAQSCIDFAVMCTGTRYMYTYDIL